MLCSGPHSSDSYPFSPSLLPTQAQHHPWLHNHDPNVKERNLSKQALANLVAFRKTNALKKLALELVARSLDHEQIRNLEKDFAKVRTRVYACLRVFGVCAGHTDRLTDQ